MKPMQNTKNLGKPKELLNSEIPKIVKPKELDWSDIVKNILFANGVKCDSEQFLIEDILALLTQQRTELLEEITDILDNIDTGMYVDDKWVSNSEELTELRKNINLLNKKDE